MATVSCLGRVVIQQYRLILSKMAYKASLYHCSVNILLPNRRFAIVDTMLAKKYLKNPKGKKLDEKADDREK